MSGTQRKSMTGYGAATVETEAYRVTVEMKSVNQRFLEIAPHMPRAFGAWESELRETIRTRVGRGKLDIFVNFEDRSEKEYDVRVNESLARAYYTALVRVARAADAPLSDGVRIVSEQDGVIEVSERCSWMPCAGRSTRSTGCEGRKAHISRVTSRGASTASKSNAHR